MIAPEMVPLAIGSRAPEFIVPNERDEGFSLSETVRFGPVLLIFYPADWGFICRNEIVEFRDRQPAFEKMGVRLVGLSTNMIISHAVWSDHLKLRFPLLSDPPGDVAAVFGVLDLAEESFNKGRTKRALFLVDQELKVLYCCAPRTIGLNRITTGSRPPADRRSHPFRPR